MRKRETTSVARSGRRQAVAVEATGTRGEYHVEELGHFGAGKLIAEIERGESGLWFTKGTKIKTPYRTLDQAIRGVALEFASVRLDERIARHPSVCGADMTLWRDEDIALAEKGLPDHCILPPGHEDGHSVRARCPRDGDVGYPSGEPGLQLCSSCGKELRTA